MFYTIATATTACVVYPSLTALRVQGNFPQCLTPQRARSSCLRGPRAPLLGLAGEVIEPGLQLRLRYLRLLRSRLLRFLLALAFLDELGPRSTLSGHGFTSLGMLLHRNHLTISRFLVVFVPDCRTIFPTSST